jgi:hypothetical protein
VAVGKEQEAAGREYRFQHLSLPLVLRDMYFTSDEPGPGDPTPIFDLATVSGDRIRSWEVTADRPALLIFGSSTCPITDDAAPGLNQLHHRFGDRVRFFMANVREAHPGAAVPQPGTQSQKFAHAQRLQQLHNFQFEVAVDDVHGSLHRAFGPKPNSAYLLGPDGRIVFRAHWASDTGPLAEALEAVVAGRRPPRAESGGVLRATLRMLRYLAPVLDRAGRGAWADMWRVAPPLAAIAWVLKALHLGPPKPRISSNHAGSRRAA